ncbi:GlxA family transcriptional regulator [Vibrio sp. RC27]
MLEHQVIKIALIAHDGANAVDVFGPLQVFSSANYILRKMHPERDIIGYQTCLVSLTDFQFKLDTQTRVIADALIDEMATIKPDTLVIAGGHQAPEVASQSQVMDTLIPHIHQTRRVASVCSGAFILAASGVLDNRRATTHWERFPVFSKRFPKVRLKMDALFTKDDKYYCSAGVTSGIDLALNLVQEDFGRRVALETSREMVAFYHRPGGQNQFSSIDGMKPAKTEILIKVQDWIEQHLDSNLEVSQLAEIAAMSVRNFSRKFTQETGLSPSRYIAIARLNKARLMLEESTYSISRVARVCGYHNSETLRRSFARELNVSPSEYRKRFHVNA